MIYKCTYIHIQYNNSPLTYTVSYEHIYSTKSRAKLYTCGERTLSTFNKTAHVIFLGNTWHGPYLCGKQCSCDEKMKRLWDIRRAVINLTWIVFVLVHPQICSEAWYLQVKTDTDLSIYCKWEDLNILCWSTTEVDRALSNKSPFLFLHNFPLDIFF